MSGWHHGGMTEKPADAIPGQSLMPVAARVHLAHAVVQHLADAAGADLLHLKGPAVLPDLRPAGRRGSTDADVLVRPSHLDRFIASLESHGWEQRTDAETGSAFAHATCWWHDDWGWLDVHLSWPGCRVPAEEAFDVLAAPGATATIAHVPCRVPDRVGQVLVLVLHAARSPDKSDVAHAWAGADDDVRDAVRALARRLRADVALAAGLGELDDHRDDSHYLLWRFHAEGGTRIDEWRARLAAAPDARSRWQVLTGSLRVNRDHLRMELGRAPTRADVRRRQVVRVRRALSEARARIGRRP